LDEELTRRERAAARLNARRQKIREEIANALSHGVGLGLALAGLAVLVVLTSEHGGAWQIASASVYGTTLLILYLASTLYHGIQKPRAKRMLRVADHVTIFFLIAGTYTPFTLVSLRGAWGWGIFAAIWILALAGTLMKLFWFDRMHLVGPFLYLAMGWLIVIGLTPLREGLPDVGLALLGAGGIFYTGGLLFFALDKRYRYFHLIWHLFVLAGSICHYFAILVAILPPRR
jgi:hemolysin III